MKRSTQRMLTTHAGSLPRPPALRTMLIDKDRGRHVEVETFDLTVRQAVSDTVRKQAEAGVTVLNDGEMSKARYATYFKDRLAGFSGEEAPPATGSSEGFPEWAARRAAETQEDNAWRPVNIGPVGWKDFGAVEKDIANLKAATKGVKAEDIFVSAVWPGQLGQAYRPNGAYKNQEEYLQAVVDVMRREYTAIVDAGFVLQIDAPGFAGGTTRSRAELPGLVEAVNHATRNMPIEQIRVHVCWGAGEGPHHLDGELKDGVELLLKVRPVGLTIAAANGRHIHEWKVWKDVKIPEGKVIIPGVIDSTTNIIEHPETVADRIVRYASVLGRENVIAGVDCGFATTGTREHLQVDPTITWAKLKSLSEGAAMATKELWRT